MLPLLCCQPRKRGSQPAPAAVDLATLQRAGSGADLAEQRILRPKESQPPLDASPSRSLLEASARRLAQSDVNKEQQRGAPGPEAAGAAGEVAQKFIQLYMAAIRDGNTRWTADASVGDLFAEDAKMVTQDKQTFHGKAAILRRLDKGVELLVKMAGKNAELPAFELEGPTQTAAEGPSQLDCTIRRGRNNFKFRLEFTVSSKGHILLLRNTRV